MAPEKSPHNGDTMRSTFRRIRSVPCSAGAVSEYEPMVCELASDSFTVIKHKETMVKEVSK